MKESRYTVNSFYYLFHNLNKLAMTLHGDQEKYDRFRNWYYKPSKAPVISSHGIIPDGFARIVKDIRDYARPYKNYQRKRDWLQHVYAVNNIGQGLIEIPLASLAALIGLANVLLNVFKQFMVLFYDNFIKTFSPLNYLLQSAFLLVRLPVNLIYYSLKHSLQVTNGLVNGVARVLYGAWQLITLPILPLKIFFRSRKTPEDGQDILDNDGMKRAIENFETAYDGQIGCIYLPRHDAFLEEQKLSKREVQQQQLDLVIYKYRKAKALGQKGTDASTKEFISKLGLKID